jgi:hypothetical protein
MVGRTRCGWWRRRWRTSAAPWTVLFGGCTHGFAGVLKVLLLLVVLLTVSIATPTFLPPTPSHSTSEFLRPRRSANPWTVEFGGCTFSGDYDGAPLVRTVECSTYVLPPPPLVPGLDSVEHTKLNLKSKGITSVPADSFQGLSQMT